MKSRLLRVVLLALVFAQSAFAQTNPKTVLNSEKAQKFSMPKGLTEVSGLAVASQNSVYAHNDEFAIIYEIDLDNGDILRAFALGDPTRKGDFEGIAVEEDRVYLINSSGHLFEAPIGNHRERVKFNLYDTGVGDFCEVEGLSNAGRPGEFFILCKQARESDAMPMLSIFKWSLRERLSLEAPWFDVLSASLGIENAEKFLPSAIEWDDATDSYVIISARNNAFIWVTAQGEVRSQQRLTREEHRQAEGLALMPDGRVIIADEGQGKKPGMLTIYSSTD